MTIARNRCVYFGAVAVPGALGGVELWCARMALQLREYGFDTGIVTADYDGGAAGEAAALLRNNYERYGLGDVGSKVPIVGLTAVGRPAAWASVSQVAGFFGNQIAALGADVLFPNELRLAWDCAAAASMLGAPLRTAAIVHTDTDAAYALVRKHRDLIAQAAGVSSAICAKLTRDVGVPAALIPYGVSTAPADPLETRRTDVLRLAYVGRLFDAQKGILLLPEIVADLKRRGITVELWVVGEGPDEPRLRAGLDAYGVMERVRWFGAVAARQIPSVLASIDILVMPSAFEGISIAMLEAMAQGVVPVVTPVSGAADVIADGKNGIIVSQRSAARMADACADLAPDRDRLRTMSAAARQTTISAHSEDVHRERLVAFIDHLMQAPAPSWPAGRFPSGRAIGRTHRWVPEPLGTAARRLSSALAGSVRPASQNTFGKLHD